MRESSRRFRERKKRKSKEKALDFVILKDRGQILTPAKTIKSIELLYDSQTTLAEFKPKIRREPLRRD